MRTACGKSVPFSGLSSLMYLLDSNVFITAKNSYYPVDFCPAFWDWIRKGLQTGTLGSVVGVRNEILEGGDDLARWVAKIPKKHFLDVTPDMQNALQTIQARISGMNYYTPSAQAEFVGIADAELVAHALAGGHTVVTLEISRKQITQIKIPDVCRVLGVPCIDTFEAIRQSKDRFVLDPPFLPLPTQGTLNF